MCQNLVFLLSNNFKTLKNVLTFSVHFINFVQHVRYLHLQFFKSLDFVKPMDISKDLFDDSDEVPSSAEKELVAPSASKIRKDDSAQCVHSSPFSLSM